MNDKKQQNNFGEICDPVEIVDKKTGLKKVAYLCKQPLVKRAQHYRENKLHFWTDIGLIATIVILISAIATLWLFNAFKHTNLVDFRINYNTEALVNGQRINFDVQYKNTSNKIVTDAQAIVRFPDGLLDISIADQRYDKNSQTVTIGTLQPDEAGSFQIEGLLLSDLGRSEKFVFVLNYFNDLGQPQQEFTSREFVVEASIVDLSLEVPSEIIIASNFPSKISITNTADYLYQNLTLQLRYPTGYAAEQGSTIALEPVNPGEIISKEVVGAIRQAAPGTYPLEVVVLQEFQGQQYVLSKTTVNASLDFSRFTLTFENTDQNQAVKPGEQTVATLRLENNEPFAIDELELSFLVDGDFTDKNFLERTYPRRVENNLVQIPSEELGRLEPGESRTITFTAAALSNIFVTSENQGSQDLTIRARASFVPQNNQSSRIYVSAQPLVVPINSKLTLASFGRFYTSTGDQIGVGSLPPRPGEYTAYWAILRLSNGVNALRNVSVTGTIPVGVDFTGVYNVTAGSPIRLFNNGTQIEWFVGEVSPYAGIVGSAPEGRVQLAIVPSESQIGQILPLLNNLRVRGIDARTGEEVTAFGADITTAIFDEDNLNRVSP